MTSPNKLFETEAEAKEFIVSQFCKLCTLKDLICEKGYWSHCLGIRKNLCPHYSRRLVPGLTGREHLSFCANPKVQPEVCIGKQCKYLPIVVIAKEQPVVYPRVRVPEVKDFKMAAARDVEDDVPF